LAKRREDNDFRGQRKWGDRGKKRGQKNGLPSNIVKGKSIKKDGVKTLKALGVKERKGVREGGNWQERKKRRKQMGKTRGHSKLLTVKNKNSLLIHPLMG